MLESVSPLGKFSRSLGRPWGPLHEKRAGIACHRSKGAADCVPSGAHKGKTTRAGARRSKRARRGAAEVKLSSGHRLWDLKLRVLEALGVHPRNALVHVLRAGRWAPLQGDDEASLAGVLPAAAAGNK